MPELLTLAAPPPLADHDGRVIITTTGITVPVVRASDTAIEVFTPCAEFTSIPPSAVARDITAAHVVIDPGHGGQETGAVGPAGLVEGDLNLDISQRLATLLRDQGLQVTLTREADYRSTLHTRSEIALALQPHVFISVHHNGGVPVPTDVPGTEIYFQSESPEAERLGGLLFEELVAALTPLDAAWTGTASRGAQFRLNTELEDAYGILRRPQGVTTALTEALFLSSEAEEALLLDPQVRDIEARALARAIIRFFDSNEVGSGIIEGPIFQGQLSSTGGPEGCIDPPLQ